MQSHTPHPLNNPVLHSLKQTHHPYAIAAPNIAFYHPDYCPFGGFDSEEGIEASIDQYAQLTPSFYIVGERPKFSLSLRLEKELVCHQMVLEHKIELIDPDSIVALVPEHKEELFNLVNLVQPGYFKKKTSDLGAYFGIFKNGALVAVTGERMKMEGFTEVSAVVTHPQHTGKGYASALVAFTTNQIFEQNKIPYLHVASTNEHAIRLYEKLGFRTRRQISFWNLTSTTGGYVSH